MRTSTPLGQSTRPLFSIITIAKDAGTVIETTLRSVASQDFEDFEYVVIDGGSADETLSIVRKYNFRKMIIVSGKDRGISHAMNKGLLHSSGSLIIHMNAGDAFAKPDVLQKAADDYGRYGWEWAIGGCELEDPRKGIIYERRMHAFDFDILRRKQIVPHQSTFVARTIFDRFGEFSEAFKVAMDYDFWLRIGQSVRPRILPFIVSRMLLGGVSSDPFRLSRELRRARLTNFGRSEGALFECTEFLWQLALHMGDKWATTATYRAVKRTGVFRAVGGMVMRHHPIVPSWLTTTVRKGS